MLLNFDSRTSPSKMTLAVYVYCCRLAYSINVCMYTCHCLVKSSCRPNCTFFEQFFVHGML